MHAADAAALGLARTSTWAAHGASPTPTWALVAAALGALLVSLWLGLSLLGVRRPPRRDDHDDWGSGPGGGGPRRPGPDGSDLPGGDPPWWPEFEREFAAYVAEAKASLR